jgi:molecular chaperone HtpG
MTVVDENRQESRAFDADVARLLHLIVHSVYSDKEVFLRELISNAADACEKLRYEAIAQPELLGDDPALRITVLIDAEKKCLTVEDNGIGMSREELVQGLGTIAHSGTKAFMDRLEAAQGSDSATLIGQFGVGFYSAFVVADKVTVITRRADAPASEGVKWESDGKGEYSLEQVELAERGTSVILHLKADEDEFLKRWQLRSLITKYSDHVAFPIRMPVEKDGKPTDEFETINAASALWTKPKSEISDADYQSFYKALGHDFNDALAWTHNRVEGSQSFTTLLYIPSQPPFDLMMGGRDERKGLKLYIKRVFIMDAAEELLPNYLRFVRGVVDADDLPLNVSREILQQNRQLDRIKSACVKRVLDLIEKLAKDEPEKFATFYKAFGNTLKEGISEDANNRERIAKLLRFASTKGEGSAQTVSFDDYIGRMPVGQDTIWFITADSYAAAIGSPQLEAFKAKGTEVLLMFDRIDEWMLGSLSEYSGKKLQNVAKGELPLDEADKAKQEEATKEAEPLLKKLKDLLGDRVGDVRVSARLTDSPSCLALADYEMAPHLARLLREAGHDMPDNKPTLEINPQHALLKRVEAEGDEAKAKDLATLLLEQAEIAAGAQLPDPSAFVQRMNRVLLG